jgi:hypothetical protein
MTDEPEHDDPERDQPEHDDEGPPETAFDAPPAEIAELAEACVRYVERSTGMRLDFAPETLPILDHYVRESRGQVGGKPELLEALAAPVGAYLGEVARRVVPARWHAPAGDYRRFRLELARVFLSFNPIGAAVEAIELADVEGWGAHFRMRPEDERKAAAALAPIPEVSEEDYYAPSNRLETLQIVADALLAGVKEPRTYEAADYGPFRAEAIGDALDGGAGTH